MKTNTLTLLERTPEELLSEAKLILQTELEQLTKGLGVIKPGDKEYGHLLTTITSTFKQFDSLSSESLDSELPGLLRIYSNSCQYLKVGNRIYKVDSKQAFILA